jgi:type IV pilus assembly protein PilB
MKTQGARHDFFADAITQIQVALKNNASYPGDHPAFSRAAGRSYETLMNLLDEEATVTLSIADHKLLIDDVPIDGNTASIAGFAKELDQRAIDSITFYRGLTLADFKSLLDAMVQSPTMLNHQGGAASILRENGVTTIQLNEVRYGKIGEDSNRPEERAILNYLGGEDDTLGENRAEFLHILADEPHRVPDLVMRAVDFRIASAHLGNHEARGEVATESMNRITRELLNMQEDWSKFKEKMTSILSSFDEGLVTEISRTLGLKGKGDEHIVDDLVTELFYRTLAGTSPGDRRQNGELDLTSMRRATPSTEGRESICPSLKDKVDGFQGPDTGKGLSDVPREQGEISQEHVLDQNRDPSSITEGRYNVRDDLTRLLSEGKNNEVKAIIRDLSEKFDDTSWKIRKNVAEHIQEITNALDEFDKLKDNFQEIAGVLLKMVKQESHIDNYLLVSDNLHRICKSRNGISRYFINESIGSDLLQADKISRAQLKKALTARKKNGKSLQYNLGALNLVDEADLTHLLARSYNGVRVITLSELQAIPEYVLKAVPVKFVKRHMILPFNLDAGNLNIATGNPDDLNVLNDIRFLSGFSPIPHLAAEYHLLNAIETFYNVKVISSNSNQLMEDMQEEDDIEEKQDTISQMAELKDSDAPVVKLVNTILKEAITKKASDIHIEPYENELRIRFRIDGTLSTLLTPSMRFTNALASRIKVMSGLDISERRLPQDGRFKVRIDGCYVDFRVSIFPGIFGEKVVLRLLDKSNLLLDMNNLGMESDVLHTTLTTMYKSKGMILVTGPTGSGKTTTLYSMLQGMNDGSRNISTAEDPIEYNLRGINQFQMHPKIGLDFARALKTFLRQDPDIIMVGEIRDLETAEIAIKAALTGHLVLSTLHTNSAPETVTRLLDIGIEPYLITSSLTLIIAQRLLRKLCEQCKTKTSPTDLQRRVLENHRFTVSSQQFYKAEGCEECNNSGYKGRVAIYEVMPMCEELQELILKGTSSFEMAKKAQECGLVTLQQQGFQKAADGITDLDEWMRTVT